MDKSNHQDFGNFFSDVSSLDSVQNLDPSDTFSIGQVSERLGGVHVNTIRNWTKLYASFYSDGARTTDSDKNRNRVFTVQDLLITNTINHLTKTKGLRAVSDITEELISGTRIYELPHILTDDEKRLIDDDRPVLRSKAMELWTEYRTLQTHVQHLERELETANQNLADYIQRYHDLDGKYQDSQGKVLDLSVERERLSTQLELAEARRQELEAAHQTALNELASKTETLQTTQADLGKAVDDEAFQRSRVTGIFITSLATLFGICLILVAVIYYYEQLAPRR